MAAAKKKKGAAGATSGGPAVESPAETAATPAAAPAAPAAPAAAPTATTTPAPEATGKRKKKWDVVENKIEFAILLNGKNAIRALCSTKAGVIRKLEEMTAKEREKAYVFKLVPMEMKTKVSVSWGDEAAPQQ